VSGSTGTVERYASEHAAALSTGDFHARVGACWGLVARGTASLDWVLHGLASDDVVTIEDAAAYCAALGIRRNDPAHYLPRAVMVEQDTSSWPRQPRRMSSSQWLHQHR